MGSLIYNKERFNQKVDFTGLSWKHPREYSAWGVADVDIRFELIRYKLYFEIEIKGESVDFLKTCGSQKMAMFKLHQVLEGAGITAPLCWATHNQPIGEEVRAADCIVQDYLQKGKWIHDGKRTVKQFMTAYIHPIMHPEDLLLSSQDKALKPLKVWHLRVITTLDGKLIYDRTLQPGSGKSTYGLEVAKAMGLPTDLMLRAYAIRRHLGGEVSADEAPKSAWNPLIRRETCEHCKNSFVRGLEVHHIHERANGGGNSLRNLAVLCDACHDKHHANEITIAPLTQTSEGLERFSYTGPLSSVHSAKETKADKAAKETKWSVDEMETIKSTALKFKGRPLARISTALQEEHHINITPAALKRLITRS